MNEDEYHLYEMRQRREDKAASYDKGPKMQHGKIVTFKIVYDSMKDGQAVIDSIKNYASNLMINNRCEISYITEEPCVDMIG